MQHDSEINSAGSRRWLYGFNMALLIVIGLIILGFFFYVTNLHPAHKDMTSSGMYSLSGETKTLLQQIADKNQNYTLMSLFGDSENGQSMTDLLDEYARLSPHIKVQKPSSSDDVEKPIRKLYEGEIKPYETTIGEFDGVAEDVGKFFKTESDNLAAMVQKPGLSLDDKRQANSLRTQFTSDIQEGISDARKSIENATDAMSPNWGHISEQNVKPIITQFSALLTNFSDPDKLKDQLTPGMLAYLTDAKPRYKAILDKVNAYKAKLDALPPLKVQDILDSILPDSVVVLGPTSAKVISPVDIVKSAGPGAAPSFVGEQAVSSALLSMVRPEKVKVVFVSPVPLHLSESVMSDIADVLRQDNFEVSDWSPPAPPGMDQAPPDMTPPPSGKGVVWIVLPAPQPTEQQMEMGMMPNAQPVVEAVQKHLDAGGSAMFLAEAVEGMPMGGGDYAYDPVVKKFGVDVEPKYTIVHEADQQNRYTGETVPQTSPQIFITRYPDHEITRPLDDLPSYFGPPEQRNVPNYSTMPTVVRVSHPLPAGVQAQVILQSPGDADYWGSATGYGQGDMAKFNKDADIASPVPMAVAAQMNVGDKQQRVIVVGHTIFAMNPILDEAMPMEISGRVVAVPAFPGNSEFFRNCTLWLAGYENMISVSPKASAAERIHNLSDSALAWIEWGILFTGAPLGVLVIGGIVWYVRRR